MDKRKVLRILAMFVLMDNRNFGDGIDRNVILYGHKSLQLRKSK